MSFNEESNKQLSDAQQGLASVLRGMSARLLATIRADARDAAQPWLALQVAKTRLCEHLLRVALDVVHVPAVAARLTVASTSDSVVALLETLLRADDNELARQHALRWLDSMCGTASVAAALWHTSSALRLCEALCCASLAPSCTVRVAVARLLLRVAKLDLLPRSAARHVAVCALARVRDCEPSVRQAYESLLSLLAVSLLDSAHATDEKINNRQRLWRRLLMAGNSRKKIKYTNTVNNSCFFFFNSRTVAKFV